MKFKIFILFLFLSGIIFPQTTGKVSGSIVDAENGKVLPGANIIVSGTRSGTAAYADGHYFIINLPPGVYDLKVTMIGYNNITVKNGRATSRVDDGNAVSLEEISKYFKQKANPIKPCYPDIPG